MTNTIQKMTETPGGTISTLSVLAVICTALSAGVTSGLNAWVDSKSDPVTIDYEEIATKLVPKLTPAIDARIEVKESEDAAMLESLETTKKQLEQALLDKRFAEMDAKVSAAEAENAKRVNAAMMKVDHRFYRFEYLDLQPRLEEWVRSGFAEVGYVGLPPMPKIPIRPPLQSGSQ